MCSYRYGNFEFTYLNTFKTSWQIFAYLFKLNTFNQQIFITNLTTKFSYQIPVKCIPNVFSFYSCCQIQNGA